jgi:small subunit ribosomal protein S20
MANIKSQKKRIKTDEKRRQRNRGVRSRIRTHINNVQAAVAEGDSAAAQDLLKVAGRELDKAAGKGAIHANVAARYKSRLTRLVSGS